MLSILLRLFDLCYAHFAIMKNNLLIVNKVFITIANLYIFVKKTYIIVNVSNHERNFYFLSHKPLFLNFLQQ